MLAAVAEIGVAWLVWQGVRGHSGVAFVGAGVATLAVDGFIATLQSTATSAGSSPPRWRLRCGISRLGMVANGFRPNRYDLVGAAVCLVGVGVIMFAARAA